MQEGGGQKLQVLCPGSSESPVQMIQENALANVWKERLYGYKTTDGSDAVPLIPHGSDAGSGCGNETGKQTGPADCPCARF